MNSKLERAGIPTDLLPERMEYRVKDMCSKITFGNKGDTPRLFLETSPEVVTMTLSCDSEDWYRDLNSWCSYYRLADPQNIAILDRLEAAGEHDATYQRSFIAPGVCRRLLGTMAA
jgi:hypothetical protein